MEKDWMKSGATVIANVLLENYEKLGFTSEQFTLFVLLKAEIDKGNTFPSAEELADKLGTNTQTIYNLLDKMIKNKLITIDSSTNADGKLGDSYSYDIIWEKLDKIYEEDRQKKVSESTELDERKLIESFEKEFGRGLTPIEMETIGYWITDDNYSLEIISLALREASLNQAYNFRYIDRILRNWEKKNIKTAADVKKENDNYREKTKQTSSTVHSKDYVKMDIPLYNWLEKDK